MSILHQSFRRILSRWPAMLLAILALPLTALRLLSRRKPPAVKRI